LEDIAVRKSMALNTIAANSLFLKDLKETIRKIIPILLIYKDFTYKCLFFKDLAEVGR